MSLTRKKTLGIAVMSLILGCLALIPVLGIIFSIAAIVLGVVALVKISNKSETFKGEGLAVSGIVLGILGIFLIPIIAMLAAIAIPNFLQAKMRANENKTRAVLEKIATAAENYATRHNGRYPSSLHSLVVAEKPYLNLNYTSGTHAGYNFECEFGPSYYKCRAIPSVCGSTGDKIYILDGNEGVFSVACPEQ
ncbi:MAG: DUF4190 domain-containing protein [Candidatus Omnitrophica bacterium]|nr:DUF4190 domain-containing protein [Candidatus Omnitrophota bacterium]MBD3269390.1 DUF4190 domain-containing protein [Candidatus Omnitrophota bacterium]